MVRINPNEIVRVDNNLYLRYVLDTDEGKNDNGVGFSYFYRLVVNSLNEHGYSLLDLYKPTNFVYICNDMSISDYDNYDKIFKFVSGYE